MNWKQEHEVFESGNTRDSLPPGRAREAVFKAVAHDLKYFPYTLWFKISMIHIVVATITLVFCPQFGVGPLSGSLGLMELFMTFGSRACALFCGALFLGTSAVVYSFVLKPGEFLYLKKNRHQIYGALALGSWLILVAMNRSSLSWESWEYNLLWVTSAVACASLFTSAVNTLKR